MMTGFAVQPQIENLPYTLATDVASQSAPAKALSAATAGEVEASREQLVLDHMGLVRQVARALDARMPAHIQLEELISAGLVGLLDAAAKFDGAKQIQFRSYAQIRIRGAILDSLRSQDWSPRELRRQSRAIAEALRTLSARLGRTPDDSELAGEMGMELRSLQQLMGELRGLELGSLNQERNEGSADEEMDHLPAPESENPFTLCVASQNQEQLFAAMTTLPERERLVLTLYYYEELTLREIGLTLGVVESRVSQLRAAGVAHLRRKLLRNRRPTSARLARTH